MIRFRTSKRWIAVAGLVALLFAQTAAALMACQQRGIPAGARVALPDEPCPMTRGAPTPLCAQLCEPDENKGQWLDPAALLLAQAAPPVAASIAAAPVERSFLEAPDARRELWPPRYLVFLRLLLP